MGGHPALRPRHLILACVLFVAACGGGGKKDASKPASKTDLKKPAAPPETEADRERKRHAAALKLVPEGSTCLPLALKDEGAPRLELAAIGADLIVCAYDIDKARLLGPVACWKVDVVGNGALTYQDPMPLPGRGIDVALDDHCARGYCLPKDAKPGTSKVAHMAWNLDGTKVVVLVGDDVHLFDGQTKEHVASFSVRGDKGVTNDPIEVHFGGDAIFVEGADQGPYSAVWGFKLDGTQIGPIVGIGGDKPLSTHRGSFSLLDKTHVAVAERGFETVTTYEIDTGKRAKAVRKLGKAVCKPDELDAFWHDGDKVTDKCKDSVMKMSGYLIGATAVMGTKSMIVLFRNDRLGELGVLDPKSLAEKKSVKMPWCDKSADKSDDALAQPKKPTK